MALKSKFLAFKKKFFKLGEGVFGPKEYIFRGGVPLLWMYYIVCSQFFLRVTHRSPINFLLFLVSLGPMCPRQFFFHSLSSSHTKCLSYPICSSVSIYIPRPSFSAKFSSFDIVHLLLQMKYCVSLPFFPPNIAGRLGEWYLYLVFFICICSVFGPHDS